MRAALLLLLGLAGCGSNNSEATPAAGESATAAATQAAVDDTDAALRDSATSAPATLATGTN